MQKQVLQTSRLMLREMTWDDLEFVTTMLTDPRVMRYYARSYSRADAERWLQRMIERYVEDGYALWLVVARATEQPVGQVGLLRQHVDSTDELEVGYLIHAPFWRQGYATEAASAVRDYALTVLGGKRVVSLIRPANIPSQRVALRIGMTPEKLTLFHDLETLVYSLSAVPQRAEA